MIVSVAKPVEVLMHAHCALRHSDAVMRSGTRHVNATTTTTGGGGGGGGGSRHRDRSGSSGGGSSKAAVASNSFAFWAELLLCLVIGVACVVGLWRAGGVHIVDALGLLLVCEYGLYRVVAPLLAARSNSSAARYM